MNPNLKDLARETMNPELKPDNMPEKTLVYSADHQVYAIVDGKSVPLNENSINKIESLCLHRNRLLYGGEEGIRDVFTEECISRNPCHILRSNGEDLFYSHRDIIYQHVVWDRQDDKLIRYPNPIQALHVLGDTIYYSAIFRDGSKYVLNSSQVIGNMCTNGRTISETLYSVINAICHYKNQLYYAADRAVYSDKIVAKLPGRIVAFASIDDKLFAAIDDLDLHTILNVFDKKEIVAKTHPDITDMVAVPTKYVMQFLKK
jgi:hypothetical protein